MKDYDNYSLSIWYEIIYMHHSYLLQRAYVHICHQYEPLFFLEVYQSV